MHNFLVVIPLSRRDFDEFNRSTRRNRDCHRTTTSSVDHPCKLRAARNFSFEYSRDSFFDPELDGTRCRRNDVFFLPTRCRMILPRSSSDRPVVPHVRVSGSGCFPDIRGMMRKISPPRCNIGTATFHCDAPCPPNLQSNSLLILIYSRRTLESIPLRSFPTCVSLLLDSPNSEIRYF